MSGLAEGDYEEPSVTVERVEVVRNAQHSAAVLHGALKCLRNAGFGECVKKYCAGGGSHFMRQRLIQGGGFSRVSRAHARIISADLCLLPRVLLSGSLGGKAAQELVSELGGWRLLFG